MHPTLSQAQISRPHRGAPASSVRKAPDPWDAARAWRGALSFCRLCGTAPWHEAHAPRSRERAAWRLLVNCWLRQLHFTVTQHGQYYE